MSPETAAGRALLEHMTEDAAGFVTLTSGRFHIKWVHDALAKDIPAIEQEARAALLDELREKVAAMPGMEHEPCGASACTFNAISRLLADRSADDDKAP